MATLLTKTTRQFTQLSSAEPSMSLEQCLSLIDVLLQDSERDVLKLRSEFRAIKQHIQAVASRTGVPRKDTLGSRR